VFTQAICHPKISIWLSSLFHLLLVLTDPILRKEEAEPTSPATFTFIVSTGSNLSVTPEERSIIRKQAMRKAGRARKARRNYGKINMIQYPVIVLREPLERETGQPTLATGKTAGHETRHHHQLVPQDHRIGSVQQPFTHNSDLPSPLKKRDMGDPCASMFSPQRSAPPASSNTSPTK